MCRSPSSRSPSLRSVYASRRRCDTSSVARSLVLVTARVDPPAGPRLPASPRCHGRRARVVRRRGRARRTRAAADPGRRSTTPWPAPPPCSSRSSPGWSRSPWSGSVMSFAAPLPRGPAVPRRPARPAASGVRRRRSASTASARTRCAPARWSRARSPTCSWCRGCCRWCRSPSGTVTLVVTSVAAMLWLSPLLTVVTLVVLPAAGLITMRTRAHAVPRDVVGAATRRRRRAAGRGDGHRGPGGQGIRPGGAGGRRARGPGALGCSPSGCGPRG